ncbi:MAG TPA: Crp/Fnr family transcriptional regulator [Candidatus Agathobaculum merdavium]|nr:Crp/Fnr family transcriptional regulator [Candidatus Agathobaculum merdavium]
MNRIELPPCPLFDGITPAQSAAMLGCLGAAQRTFDKHARLLSAGDTTAALGLILSGSALIQSDDLWGNTTVLDRVRPGQIFAETYACTGEPLLVDVVAAEPCTVLFIDVGRVLHVCSNTCAHHERLIRNLLTLSAQKNLGLSRKIFHTSSKSIRGRLLSYLSYQARRCGSRTFTIPFDRQQLADYLNVDRSALSNELGKMQKEGLLQTQRSRFVLLCDEEQLPEE